MIVWVPFPDADEVLGPVPAGVELLVWAGGQDLPGAPEEVDVLITPYPGIGLTLDLLPRMQKLRVLQVLTAGYEHVAPHVPSGVALCNARGVHDASTAEHAVGLTIASLRGIPGFVRAQDQGVWAFAERPALADKRVLIIGAGSIAEAMARRFAPFEVEVSMVGRTAREGVHGVGELPDLLPYADVVVLAVPLSVDTRGLVNAEFLASLPDGALVVNVARGPVVDTQALLAELESGRLLAALDVTDPEPLPPGHPLWKAPNVLIAPHVGGASSAFFPRAYALVSRLLDALAAGEAPPNVVNAPNTQLRTTPAP
jgi:phosphoglycerate dehydrogenase-like enzyme